MVVEACEAYESFLDLYPEIAVVTNIEADHLDHHGTEEHLRQSFVAVPLSGHAGGAAVLCGTGRNWGRSPRRRTRRRSGMARRRWRGARDGVRLARLGGRCRLVVDGRRAGELTVGAPGEHNLLNALGALAVSAGRRSARGGRVQRRWRSSTGWGRRFEVLGEVGRRHRRGRLRAPPDGDRGDAGGGAGAFPGRGWWRCSSRTCTHAPGTSRRHSRRRSADLQRVDGDLPGAGSADPGRDPLIADLLAGCGEDAVLEVAKEDVVANLPEVLASGDVVVLMGAGDIGRVARDLACRMASCPVGEGRVTTKE